MQEIKCIVCGKLLEPLELFPIDNPKPESSCWDGAIVEAIMGGYGSQHDLSRFVIGICDECIDQKLKSGDLFEDVEQEKLDRDARLQETIRILKEMEDKGILKIDN